MAKRALLSHLALKPLLDHHSSGNVYAAGHPPDDLPFAIPEWDDSGVEGVSAVNPSTADWPARQDILALIRCQRGQMSLQRKQRFADELLRRNSNRAQSLPDGHGNFQIAVPPNQDHVGHPTHPSIEQFVGTLSLEGIHTQHHHSRAIVGRKGTGGQDHLDRLFAFRLQAETTSGAGSIGVGQRSEGSGLLVAQKARKCGAKQLRRSSGDTPGKTSIAVDDSAVGAQHHDTFINLLVDRLAQQLREQIEWRTLRLHTPSAASFTQPETFVAVPIFTQTVRHAAALLFRVPPWNAQL